MNIQYLLLFTVTLICFTNAHSMEQLATTHNTHQIILLSMPEDIWIHIFACCEAKDALRKTCKDFYDFEIRNKERILQHPSLVLSNEGLETLFLYYGALGNSAIVRNLLLKGANPNACDDKNMSVMHYAAQYGYVDIVDIVLQHPNLTTADTAKGHQSPLACAIQYNQNAVVKQIVLAGKFNGGNILCYAVEKGSLNTVRMLITSCGIDVNVQSAAGYYPLSWAALEGHLHIARFLIAHGAAVNCCSTNTRHTNLTPLHYAAHKDYTNMVQLLIECGAEVNAKESVYDRTPLYCAAQAGCTATVEMLLKNNADIHARTNYGDTPLHGAVRWEPGGKGLRAHFEAISILLKYHAHINAQSNTGDTPLDLSKNVDIIKLLTDHGGKTRKELEQLEKDILMQ